MPPKPKPPPQKSRTSPSSKSLSDKPKPRRKLDRALALEILIAKLESTKTCDWYALSQRLAAPEKEREKEEKAKRKVEKSKKELSGSELHDLYHNVSFAAPFKLTTGRSPGSEEWACSVA